jgi:hypothetical protein
MLPDNPTCRFQHNVCKYKFFAKYPTNNPYMVVRHKFFPTKPYYFNDCISNCITSLQWFPNSQSPTIQHFFLGSNHSDMNILV